MLSKAKSLVKNHWKKVVYGGVAFQVASYGLKYATRRVIKGHQEKAKEVWIQMKKHEHFEKTHTNAVSTYISLLPILREKIEKCLNSDVLTASLKDKTTTNKLEIWAELKCIAFSRMLSSIYASSLLNVLLHLQLSVMGGYLIQDCCSKKVNGSNFDEEGYTSSGPTSRSVTIDEALKLEYLSLSDYFVQEGLEKLCNFIHEKTKAVVGPMALTRKLTVHDLEQTIWHIIESLKNDIATDGETDEDDFVLLENSSTSNNPVKNAWKYIFPPTVLNRYNNFCNVHQSTLQQQQHGSTSVETVDMRELIMTETFDLLQSQDVEFLLTSFETFGVSSFLDQLVDIVAATTTQNNNNNINNNNSAASSSSPNPDDNLGSGGPSISSSKSNSPIGNESSNPNYNLPREVSIPLAKLIPLVNNFFPNNLQASNPWITSTTQTEKLRDFSANIYESFSTPFPF